MKPKILFLCTGNSCRSQMAEGWGRKLLADKYEFFSAGTEPHGLNLNAIKVMAEGGVDISTHSSKALADLDHYKFDLVVTVCDNAAANCPLPPAGCKVMHVPFDDPPLLARNIPPDGDQLAPYRRVSLEIKDFIVQLPHIIESVRPST